MHSYATCPKRIEYGENFIVHREGPEATPYLPNVIVSSNPLVRPEDYGIPLNAEHWDERTVRNVKMPWSKVKQTKNFLWEKGFQFYCLTPKSRHSVHQRWSNVDWHSDGLELRRSLPPGQAPALRRRTSAAHEPAGGARSRHQRRRLRLRRRQPGGSAVPRRDARRSVLQGRPLHAALHLQRRLSVQRRHDEACAVHRDGENREGAPNPARRALADGEHRLPIQSSASARSNRSRATGTCRCTRPTRCSTSPKRS